MPVLTRNRMSRQNLIKIVAIGVSALAIGILWNLLYPQGIHPRELAALFSPDDQTEFRTVSVDSAIYLFFEEEALFVDIRTSEDYQIDHIPHAVSMPFREFLRNPSRITSFLDGRPLVLYEFQANQGAESYTGKLMMKEGATEILLLKEGFAGWIEAGMPVERPGDQ